MTSEKIKSSVMGYALRPPSDIDARLEQLEAERDLERTFELAATAVAMAGLFLGIFGRRRYLLLPALALPYLFQSARRGDTAPMAALRRLGLRSRDEILQETYALKALRGDFHLNGNDDPAERAMRALRAVDAAE
jgi:hypothetical protein